MTSDKRGSMQALIGGLLGLAAGLFLGGLRVLGGPPGGSLDQPSPPYDGLPPGLLEEAPGNVVFTLVLISPYIMALVSTRLGSHGRGTLLIAASLLSLASIWISLAGAGLVFLPAIVLLIVAAVKSFKASGWRGRRTVVPLVIALVATVVVGLSYAALFQRGDPRCWEWVVFEDRTEWRSIPVPEGSFQGQGSSGQIEVGPLPPGATSSGSECTSDVITGSEAARSLGLLAAGTVLLAAGLWYGRRGSAPGPTLV